MIQQIFFYILLLLSCSFVQAQEHYSWQLTDEEGLPSMEVYHLMQDSKGYMWIATDAGLCRYDGLSLKTYKHPAQKSFAVTGLQEDAKGQVWVRTFRGQLFYVDQLDTMRLFELPDSVLMNTYSSFVHLNNKLIIGTSQLYSYDFDHKTWQIDSIPNMPRFTTHATTGISTRQDHLLFINYANQLWLKKGRQMIFEGNIPLSQAIFAPFSWLKDSILLVQYTPEPVLYLDKLNKVSSLSPHALIAHIEHRILNVYVDTKERMIWVGTTNGALGYQQGLNGKWHLKHHLLPQKQISTTLRDREGNFWLSTLQNGIFVFPSLAIKYFNASNSSLSSSHINCLSTDDEDNLLLGSADANVLQFGTQEERVLHHYTGINSNIQSITFDSKRNQILFYAGGLNIAQKNAPNNIKSYRKYFGGHHMSIYKKDYLIEGRSLGAFVYNLKDEPAKIAPNLSDFNNQFHFDSTFVDDKANYVPIIHSFSPFRRTTSIWVDKMEANRFWIGYGDTLYCYQDAIPSPILDANGLPFIATNLNQTSDGSIWAATANNGLYKIVNQKVVSQYTVSQGLPSNSCRTLATDGAQIWLGTNKGLVKIDPKTNHIEVYNALDGLVSEEIRDIEIIGKKVWIASVKGLICFDTSTLATNNIPPLIHLTSILVNKEILQLEQTRHFLYHENNFKFNFQTSALKGKKDIQYEYRILSLDSAWTSLPFTTNFVQFQGLAPDQYTFEVRAVNEDGFKSLEPARFSFTISPPYWQTWWFQSLTYLGIILIITGLVAWRYKGIREKQNLEVSMNQLKMQALQSQMNPHFVFNAMSTIQSFWVQKQPKVALLYHAKFAKLMRLIFDYSKELSIHISEELDFLKIYISLEQMRFEDEIVVNFDIEDQLLEEEIYIPPLLIQPIVENSFKHGLLHKKGTGLLVICLKKEGNYVYCNIQDDGVGRDKAKEHNAWQKNSPTKRSSTHVTQERLTILNKTYGCDLNQKTFLITDLKDSRGQACGTQTELWIPILDLAIKN